MALRQWAEAFLYAPSPGQKALAFLLFPVSLVYCLFALLSFFSKRPKPPEIPVVSIGNLTVGGSGKTPFTIALAKELPGAAVLLRGYGRKSRGTLTVAHGGQAPLSVEEAGDEALLYARSLPGITVIVAEDREEGIAEAARLGAKAVLLDDGFRHRNIRKMDLLLVAADAPALPFCLPAGAYRLPPFLARFAHRVVREGTDYLRKTAISRPGERMVLVTAIARPERLEPFLPPVVGKVCFPDHHFFTEEELEEAMKEHDADRLLVTGKDAVKIDPVKFPLSLLELEVSIAPETVEAVRKYVNGH